MLYTNGYRLCDFMKRAATQTEQLLDDSIAKYSVVLRKEFRGVSVIFCGYSLPRCARRFRTG